MQEEIVGTQDAIVLSVKDLGMAAYMRMQGFRLKSRRGKEFQFFVPANEQEAFQNAQIEYVNSPFAAFDSEIMNLKKLPFNV